jgi:hypothetical protein
MFNSFYCRLHCPVCMSVRIHLPLYFQKANERTLRKVRNSSPERKREKKKKISLFYKKWQNLLKIIFHLKTWIIFNGIAMMHDVFFLLPHLFTLTRNEEELVRRRKEGKFMAWNLLRPSISHFEKQLKGKA